MMIGRGRLVLYVRLVSIVVVVIAFFIIIVLENVAFLSYMNYIHCLLASLLRR